SCIWDVSGADVISYSGSGVATIDLRAATLLNAVGGGGYVSFVFGVHGGFTIANGVVIENATGGSGADTLIGNDAANILNGGAGADTMTGNAGDDTYVVDNPSDAVNESSGGGADTIQSSVSWTLGANFENLTLTGGAANGTGNAVANVITGNSAANTLSGGGDNDSINGGDGADTLMGEDGADTLNGGDGADTITGGAGVDNVSGGDGDDVINYNFGDGVDSSINGGAGTDRIVTQGHAGGETLDVIWNGAAFTAFKGSAVVSVEQAIVDMGGGVDWLRHHNSSVAVNVNLGAGTATGFLSIANIENAWGSAFNDTLTGSAVANIIRGGAGDDAIDGGAGADTIVGDDGADAINGGDDADSIYGLSGADIVNGGNGDDTINYSFGEGVDSIDGGAGTDTIICQGNSGAETLEVAWDGLSFTFFKGGAVASIEQATVDMGLGGDWLRFTASSVGISINLTANTASGFLSIANVENAAGGGFNDTITGSAAANNLLGNDGADAIDGAGGNDTLNGGAGADTLTGGAGSDSLTGGADADTFVFATGAGGDTINDFDANATGGQDFLNIVGYGITSGDFGPRVVISDQGVNTLVTIDGTNTILLLGVTGDGNNVITQADFILGP
ncbi:MAG: beta strand repeat-containing protein, partial [Caulobacteraceae bacterium]